jgi:acyl CoA:acetate/3-ketoacid CoA transferase
MQNYTRNKAKCKIPGVLSLYTKGGLSTFVIPRGQKCKLTVAQNEKTELSDEARTRERPKKCKFKMDENKQSRR